MSVYQEFAEHVDERQRRLARQQFWVSTKYEWRRAELGWKIFFILAFFLFLATLLGAAMFQDGCNGPKPTGGPKTAPAAASSTVESA